MRIVPATLLATVFAVALGAGKFLFYGRHTAAINLLAQMAGGLLGAYLAARLARVRWPGRQGKRRLDKASSPGTVL
jgi:uncharacterized membrane protein YfcA